MYGYESHGPSQEVAHVGDGEAEGVAIFAFKTISCILSQPSLSQHSKFLI